MAFMAEFPFWNKKKPNGPLCPDVNMWLDLLAWYYWQVVLAVIDLLMKKDIKVLASYPIGTHVHFILDLSGIK